MSATRIHDLPAAVGRSVTVAGWLTGSRSSGKIAFLQLRDGSGFVQAVVSKGDVDEATFEVARGLGQESAVRLTGTVRADPRAPSGVELATESLEVVHATVDYPITPKEHGVEFLADLRHLHLRHRGPWAILRVRDEVERAMHDFFAERGFVRFDAPFFMPTAVEGTTNLFEIDLFDEGKAYLSQSGQLYAEAGAMALGAVYTMGPTFRAEKSKTRRHLLEFWMVEPEVAFLEHDGNVRLQVDLLAYLVGRVLENRRAELDMLGRDVARLEPAAAGDYPVISYDRALEILAEAGSELAWGDDFGAPHETILGERFDRPVVIEKYPTARQGVLHGARAGRPDAGPVRRRHRPRGLRRADRRLATHPRPGAARASHRRTRPAGGGVQLVPRPAPLRKRAPRGLRDRPGAHVGLDHRRAPPARGHPVPPHADADVPLSDRQRP
jgi:asparaginyl-tRNA synthetase